MGETQITASRANIISLLTDAQACDMYTQVKQCLDAENTHVSYMLYVHIVTCSYYYIIFKAHIKHQRVNVHCFAKRVSQLN